MPTDQALLAWYNAARKSALQGDNDPNGYPVGDALAHLVALRHVVNEVEAAQRKADDNRSTDELFSAGATMIERGLSKWVDEMADSIESELKEYDSCQDWDEWSREKIESVVDGSLIYTFDIKCVLFSSRNTNYAVDEGLVEEATSENEPERAHYAFLEDVRDELTRRGALEEPEPVSEAPESEPCPDTEPRPDSAVDPRCVYHGDGEPPTQAIDIDTL